MDEKEALALLKRRILIDRGFDVRQYKENYLKRRVAVRMRATGTANMFDYLRLLRDDSGEYSKLFDELTINGTQFFRDEDVYIKLRDKVIPDIIDRKKDISARSIRAWSVGCASGEEPYSIAMLIDFLLGSEMNSWNVRILASDIDEGSLEATKRAIYQTCGVLKGMDPDRYFIVEETESGRVYRVRDEIKRHVRVEKIDLLKENEKKHFDLLLCRNVLIYFSKEVQREIVLSLASSMVRDGYLVLGKSETLGPEGLSILEPAFPRERIFRLVGETRGEVSRRHS
ncbi:MAG: protein-glutamate O-methyltransferase CheR [Actinomycetota bacterium]|nr:protein-glutamate O-methyltransferase CheR [Actinomycetota bacterium]